MRLVAAVLVVPMSAVRAFSSQLAKAPHSSSRLGPKNEVFSLAPMLDYTDKNMRYLHRMLYRRGVLWTEMVVANVIVHKTGEALDEVLGFDHTEHPVVLQIGGSNAAQAREACRIARPYGYDGFNLNCGCPSEKVAGDGCFGAALMREPERVAAVCSAMWEGGGGSVPVSVKCRIGVDNDDSYEQLASFVQTVHEQGNVNHFVMHARKAILGGLSPDQNRKIPPLRHDVVYRLLLEFPQLQFTINGGIETYEQAQTHLSHGVHGVMVGRALANNPWYWSQVDSKFYDATDPGLTRRALLEQYGEYADREESGAEASSRVGCRRRCMKPVFNLFHGEPGGRLFRRVLTERLAAASTASSVLAEACSILPDYVLDRMPGEPIGRTHFDDVPNGLAAAVSLAGVARPSQFVAPSVR